MDHATTETENDSTANSPKTQKRRGGKKKKKGATFNQKEDKTQNKVTDTSMSLSQSKSRQFAKLNEMRQNRVIPLFNLFISSDQWVFFCCVQGSLAI